MSIAYLILAHHQPVHLARLIAALTSPRTSFFVHLDRKARYDEFAHLGGPDLTFCEPRVPVHWGEYSQVEAIFRLITEALAGSRQPDYLVLLSGSDYPLRSADYITGYFETHRGTEFINLVAMPNPEVGKSLDRLTGFRILANGSVRRGLRETLRRAGLSADLRRDPRKHLGMLKPYAGSTWWALSRDACHHILNFARTERRVMRFFRHTICPDEIVFQTILGNSPFRERVGRNLTYADWSGGGDSPSVIDGGHVALFERCDRVTVSDSYGTGEALFARKFSEDREDLLARMDVMIRRKDDPNRSR